VRVCSFVIAISLCSCASVKLPNSQTASEQFSTLGYHEKVIARNFYDFGSGDAIKRLYWAQRGLQRYRPIGTADGSSGTILQRKYVVLPVPEHIDPNGTIKEANNQIVEVVQLWKAVHR
jgi:hypothetical protein